MPVLKNRVYITTATTGAGIITLGSPILGYQSFADAGVSDGDTVRYTIEDGVNFEIGEGVYTASGTTLSRTPSESSNSGSAINLSGGARVFITPTADDIQQPPSEGPFVDGDKTKLDGIEAGADITDTANVAAAGALMDSEVTNLAQVKAFDSADYATAAQGSLADSALQSGDNVSALTNDAGYTTNVGTITGVTAGSGITGGGTSGTVTVSHADTSAQASVNNSGRTFIQDITLDTYGHVTGIVSATDADTFTGTVTSVATGGGLTGGPITTSGTISHADTSSQSSVNNSGATVIQDVTLDTYGHVTALGSKTLTAADVGAITGNQTITLSGDLSGSGATSINAQIVANAVGANELNVSGDGTSGQVLTSDGDGTFTWATSGGAIDDIFYENSTTVSSDYTLTTGKNAMSAGPITIADGVTVTVPSGSTWTVVT